MNAPEAKEPPAQITAAEKSIGIVRLGRAMDGRPIAYYASGSFSYRVDIAESREH